MIWEKGRTVWAFNRVEGGVLFSIIKGKGRFTKPGRVSKWAPVDAAMAEWASNQVAHGITFDDIDAIHEELYGPPLPELTAEAIETTQAKAYQAGPEWMRMAGDLRKDTRAMRDIWKALTADQPIKVQPKTFMLGLYQRALFVGYSRLVGAGTKVDLGEVAEVIQVQHGPDDWFRTVFETVKMRKSLRSDEWVPSLFNIVYGSGERRRRVFAGPTHPVAIMAMAWLEGDNTVEPLNPQKDRLRDNGDYKLVLPSGKVYAKGKKKGQPIPLTVWVSSRAFLPHAMCDKDSIVGDGSFSHIELKRGRKPKDTLLKDTIKYVKKWMPVAGYFVRMRGELGEIVTLGTIQHELRCKAETRWSEPVVFEIPEELITDEIIRTIANASEDETVRVDLMDEYVDEEVSTI